MKKMNQNITTASTSAFFNVADYSDVVIRLLGTYDGSMEFYAANTVLEDIANYAPLAVQDLESTNWTTAVTSETGASPSIELKQFRVSVAGLTSIAVKSASGFSGQCMVIVTAVSNTNAR